MRLEWLDYLAISWCKYMKQLFNLITANNMIVEFKLIIIYFDDSETMYLFND